jgi:hypothetical protein
MPRVKADPAVVLRRVKRELRRWIRQLAPRDDRARGHLEAMRHIATVIENAERRDA